MKTTLIDATALAVNVNLWLEIQCFGGEKDDDDDDWTDWDK